MPGLEHGRVRPAWRRGSCALLVAVAVPKDVAVVRIDPPRGLRPAHWADSADLVVGAAVLAMGNPLALEGAVTEGIISATGRTVTVPATGASPQLTLPDMVQTSAGVHPMTSGGALVALDGTVVGVPTAWVTAGVDAAPAGFAIPADDVRSLADQLIADGVVTRSGRADVGAQLTTVLDGVGRPRGVGVVSVEPADRPTGRGSAPATSSSR
ncbi:S1C family serine protease [Modestobacter caceresii]|jgi:putative serine protease PepD|uniref:S1C family serine protease n=1 Tax=Modestobacter caceresii TaxID=1522368 RepID=UPI00068E8804|nr:trypsin-like peptidase domain-containing protein [Modestobacter caceresii]